MRLFAPYHTYVRARYERNESVAQLHHLLCREDCLVQARPAYSLERVSIVPELGNRRCHIQPMSTYTIPCVMVVMRSAYYSCAVLFNLY